MRIFMTALRYILIALFIIGLNSDLIGQSRKSPVPKQYQFQDKNEQRNYPSPEFEIENIIAGLNDGSVSNVSRYFSNQVYLSLKTGERGYYSNNQAYYLLDKFFKIYEPISFQTTAKMIESANPYLAGKLFCRFKGSIDTFQFYMSLNWNGFRWEITQISIN